MTRAVRYGSPMTGRIPAGTLSSLRPINYVVARVASRVVGAPDMHLFSTLGQTRGLFRAWLVYSARLMPFGTLARRDAETVILRVAAVRECGYEQDHHRRLGRRAGLSAAEITALEDTGAGPQEDLDARARDLVAAVDELLADRDLTDATWTRLGEHLTDRQRIEFVLLVTQYDGLATTIGTLRIPRDYA